MTERQRLRAKLKTDRRKIERLKKEIRITTSLLWLLDQQPRPRVSPRNQRKIDALIQDLLDRGITDWSYITTKVNDHRFRLLKRKWQPMILRQYWEERKV